jgi:hypothetical protein
MSRSKRELDPESIAAITDGFERNSDRDRNFAAYIQILDKVEGLLTRLSSFEVPDREQRSFRFSLPYMTYSECPGSLGDYLMLDKPLEMDVTTVHEVETDDIRSQTTPESLQAFYGVSVSLFDENNIVMVSRDKSARAADGFSVEDVMTPAADVVVAKGVEPREIPRVSTADLQRLVLLGAGHTAEELRGIDMDQADIFAPEKRPNLEAILYESCLTSHRVVEYEFPDEKTFISATYESSADKSGAPAEDLQLFTISFGNPKHVASLQLDKGLEVTITVGEKTSLDSGEIVKFVEALNGVAHSIENRRPKVATISPADIQTLEEKTSIKLV